MSFALNVWNSSGHDFDGGQMVMDIVGGSQIMEGVHVVGD